MAGSWRQWQRVSPRPESKGVGCWPLLWCGLVWEHEKDNQPSRPCTVWSLGAMILLSVSLSQCPVAVAVAVGGGIVMACDVVRGVDGDGRRRAWSMGAVKCRPL